MRLFHITCHHHIKRILADGFINVTESNIGAPEIMNLDLHREIASQEEGAPGDPPLVMVWNPNDPTDALTIPRELLARAEARKSVTYKRLTSEEIDREVGSSGTYSAKVIVGFEPDVTTEDGKYGDVFSDTDATTEDMTPYGEHVGPDVVWLTRDATPRQAWATPVNQNQLWVSPGKTEWESIPEEYRKDTVLMVVDIPDDEVHKWSEWAFEQGINPAWYNRLAMGLDEHENWYVVTRPIPMTEWVGIWDTKTSQVAWLPPGTLPEGQQNELGVPHEEYTYDVPMPDAWIPTRLQKSNPYKRIRD